MDFFDFQQLIPTIAADPPSPRYRLGAVSAVNTDRTINVTVGASTTVITNVKYLGNVQPLPGAPIWLVSDGFDMFAIGVIASNDRTFAPRASRSTNQNITNSTDEAITFDGVNSDSWGAWSAGQAQRVYAKITGRHMAIGQVTFENNSTGHRGVYIERTGTTNVGRTQVAAASGGPTWLQVTSQPFDMTAGTDYVRLIVRQTSGGTLACTNSSTYAPALSLIYLGP